MNKIFFAFLLTLSFTLFASAERDHTQRETKHSKQDHTKQKNNTTHSTNNQHRNNYQRPAQKHFYTQRYNYGYLNSRSKCNP